MDKKHIIFACKGNIGRSPVAELVGNQYLECVGAQREYVVSSRGTITDAVLGGLRPQEEMLRSIDIFMLSGDFDSSFDRYKGAIKEENAEEIKKYAIEVATYCARREMDKRDAFLKELGVKGLPSRNPQQLATYDPVDYLFAIDRKVYEDITQSPGGIYHGRQRMPIVDVLSVFATGRPEEKDAEVDLTDIESVWQGYRESIRSIVEHTPLALKRIIGA